MVIILIKKRLLKVIIIPIFIFLLVVGFYVFIVTGINSRHSAVLIKDQNIIEDTNVGAFLVLSSTYEYIEIFDISKGSVVKSVHVNDNAIAEAKKCLESITGIYVKVKAIPENGYILKVPFEPEVKVKNQWLNDNNINSVDKIFIIFPLEGKPYLLVLDHSERPYFYNFDCNTSKLLKSLKFDLDKL